VYEFAGLFNAEIQGVNDIRVFGRYDGTDGMASIWLLDSHDPSGAALTEDSPSKRLTPGQKLKVGMRVDTHAIDLSEYTKTVTIGSEFADGS